MASTTMVKCLVWDLDDTLWNGTLLEDGSVEVAPAVRELVKTLDARGILQSVASKNDHEHAWARLEELGLAEYFVLPQIGWHPKSRSVKAIADDLKFALETIAFVDDRDSERAEVTYHHPQVRTYRAEDVLELAGLPEFSPATVTVDSRRRRQMYQASFRRQEAQAGFAGPDEDFLRSLDLRMTILPATDSELSRVEELTRRTSQMNATGIHYPDEKLRSLLDDPSHRVLVVSMQDRFGPHGAVGVLLLETFDEFWHLKLLATSCRVVSFGAGSIILRWLANQAATADAHLVADFRPTDRNRMMEIAYRFAGFADDACACTAVLPDGEAPGLQRLHLEPAPQEEPTTVTLVAPDLTEPAGVR